MSWRIFTLYNCENLFHELLCLLIGYLYQTQQPDHTDSFMVHTCRENARFTYKRTPDQIKSSDPHIHAAFKILQHLWNKDYPAVWVILTRSWPDQLLGLIAALTQRLQEHILDLVSKSYSNISSSKLARLSGIHENIVIERTLISLTFDPFLFINNSQSHAPCLPIFLSVAMKRGWTVKDGLFIIPIPPSPPAPSTTQEADLSRLAEYVVFLHEKTSSFS